MTVSQILINPQIQMGGHAVVAPICIVNGASLGYKQELPTFSVKAGPGYMRNFHFLTLVVILPLVIAAPPMRVSATKSGSRPPNYAPGEVIVKLKAGAP